jgi:6-phosphogluconolactonase
VKVERFRTTDDLNTAVAALLEDHFEPESFRPHAIVLSGGKTPLPTYQHLVDVPVEVGDCVHVLFSDERMVPEHSPDSNYGNARPMLAALRIPDERVLKVHTGLSLRDAADRYDRDLAAFLRNGDVTLAVLGLGADGHTASLFSPEDISRGRGCFAMAVPRDTPPDRVTITPDFLLHVQRIVFMVSGPGKAGVIQKLIESPQSIPAGQAVAGASNVELWIG